MVDLWSGSRRGNSRGVVILAVVGISLLGWFTVRWFAGSASPPSQGQPIAEQFLAEIRNGQVDAAWEATTTEFKSFMGRDRFRKFVMANPILQSPHEVVVCQEASEGGLPLWECIFKSNDEKSHVRVLLAAHNKEWKVERLYVE